MSIKAGDLVMAIRGMPCCGKLTGIEGVPFVVATITPRTPLHCNYCRADLSGTNGAVGVVTHYPVRLSRLIKIDPPSIPEFTNDKEELVA